MPHGRAPGRRPRAAHRLPARGRTPPRARGRDAAGARRFEVVGETVNAVPCRHVRRLDDGRTDHTRIMESLKRYRCNGREGWGLAEYMDHVDADGRFEGVAAGW